MSVKPLNPLTLPLTDRRLIEASAGTGKTYTISGLYLRLLLGDENKAPLTCEQILVVTFTNAATAELRDRIRKRIKACYQRFIGLTIDDPFIEALFLQTPKEEHHITLQRLNLALQSLDEASIFTIHGFCQRILSDMAFESALLFESEFTLDDSEYLHHSVCDYWREACYNISEFLAYTLLNEKLDQPSSLMQQIRPLLGANQAKANIKPQKFASISQALTEQITRLQSTWESEKEQIFALLHSLPLNGTIYGKKADNFPKLAQMLDELDNWSNKWQQGFKVLPPAKAMDKLALHNIKLNKGGELPTAQQAPFLAQIENFNTSAALIVPAFLYEARQRINERFTQLKQDNNILSPDDLLLTLAGALDQLLNDRAAPLEENTSSTFKLSDSLRKSIFTRFPIALIDEFQDTDPLQFAIFSSIYPEINDSTITNETESQSKQTLLMIGDPKQAIYAFRGADIFTYINARKNTQHHYNLDTNYRSSKLMVNGVNQLFQNNTNPFISDEIPFESVDSADNGTKVIKQSDSSAEALKIRLLSEDPESGLNKTDARQQLANDTANQIANLLNDAQTNDCQLVTKENELGQQLKAKDIAILVRDRNEAAVMREALNERNIGAVFLSRDSVMSSHDAREMLLILRALENPKNERAIRSALACRLIGYSAKQIDDFNQSETKRAEVLEEFHKLNHIWLTRGIMPALLSFAAKEKLLERLRQEPQSERRLTDFRHIAELLQQKSAELDGMTALLNWFEQEINLGRNSEEQQLRLDSEQNLVQIVTIHKSKGLEYPICFIPFISLARTTTDTRPSPLLFHKNDKLIWDLEGTKEGWETLKQEILAEDLRLLYVALTRPIYRCYLSIANHSRKNNSGVSSYLYKTAIGYLLNITEKNCPFAQIQTAIERLLSNAISMDIIDPNAAIVPFNPQTDPSLAFDLKALTPAPKPLIPWRVGSYSGLVKHLPHESVQPGAEDEIFDLDTPVFEEDIIEPQIDRFSFERGANAGSFMHLVLELIDFENSETELETHLPVAMKQYGFDEKNWYKVLYHWYIDILHTPLNGADNAAHLSLATLSPANKLVEMEFYLPLTKIEDRQLSQLLTNYGYSGNFIFDEFKGMLKGFIDLTFEFDGRFYIADYKSNHLGDTFSDYNQVNMAAAISSHRYDLQYLIYTLALHRYLRLKLPNYDYDTHFGGCYYLFLRGMSQAHTNSGVFFDKPEKALIVALDNLFSQNNQTVIQQQETV